MTRQALTGHTLVVIATLSGIVGMGLMYDAVSRGDVYGMCRAAPLLLVGLWWAGRELGRSMMASRSRREVMPAAVASASAQRPHGH